MQRKSTVAVQASSAVEVAQVAVDTGLIFGSAAVMVGITLVVSKRGGAVDLSGVRRSQQAGGGRERELAAARASCSADRTLDRRPGGPLWHGSGNSIGARMGGWVQLWRWPGWGHGSLRRVGWARLRGVALAGQDGNQVWVAAGRAGADPHDIMCGAGSGHRLCAAAGGVSG